MQVKCIDTGEKIDRNNAYNVPIINNKGKTINKYYSSEEGYKLYRRNVEYRFKCIDLIMEYMGYQKGMRLPTIIYKDMEEYEMFGFDVLYDTIVCCKEGIEWALRNKDFSSETAKAMYLLKILQNHFMESWRKKVAQEREDKMSETNNDPNEYDESRERRQAVRNISEFLDDE